MTLEQSLAFSKQRGQRWMAVESNSMSELLGAAITANRRGYCSAIEQSVELADGQRFGPVTLVLLYRARECN